MSAWLSEWIQAYLFNQCMFLGKYFCIFVYQYERHVYMIVCKDVWMPVCNAWFFLSECVMWMQRGLCLHVLVFQRSAELISKIFACMKAKLACVSIYVNCMFLCKSVQFLACINVINYVCTYSLCVFIWVFRSYVYFYVFM